MDSDCALQNSEIFSLDRKEQVFYTGSMKSHSIPRTRYESEGCGMNEEKNISLTDNERELLNLIRSAADPEKALITATEIIVAFLKQL